MSACAAAVRCARVRRHPVKSRCPFLEADARSCGGQQHALSNLIAPRPIALDCREGWRWRLLFGFASLFGRLLLCCVLVLPLGVCYFECLLPVDLCRFIGGKSPPLRESFEIESPNPTLLSRSDGVMPPAGSLGLCTV